MQSKINYFFIAELVREYIKTYNFAQPKIKTMENNTNHFWKHTLTMGVIMGVISIVESVLMYIFNYIPASIIAFILFFLINIAITVIVLRYAILSYRKNYLGGYITLGQAFMVALMTVVIGTILTQIYTVIFNTLIDPQYMAHVQQISKDSAEQMMKKSGLSDDMIQSRLANMDKQFAGQTHLKSALWAFIGGTVIGAIVSFIMAAILKKDKDAIA